MMQLTDFSWAFLRVIGDWKKRQPKQARNCLPPNYTARTMRHIRIHACRDAAPKTIECAKWTQVDPYPRDPTIPSYPLDMDEREGPFLQTSEYVCDKCNHRCVTNEQLISKLGLDVENPDFNVRTLQRYMNSEEPMPTDQFRRAIANAFLQEWLGRWQTITIWMHIDQLEASRKGLIAIFRRAMERKTYLLHKKFDITEQDLEKEMQKQMRLLDNQATRAIDQRLKAKDLPPDVRQFMEEALLEKRKKK